MDSRTLELFRWLQSGPYDEGGLERIRALLQPQRRLLRGRNDLDTLAEIIDLLEGWAEYASEPRLATLAMLEASDIAERELNQPERAAELRARASADADQRHAERQATSFSTLGARRAEAGDLDGAIEAYEKALDADANVEIIYALADLYTQRAAPGDAEQAADLYCTLGDTLGNPDGIAMLERALALAPKHAEARALFDTYIAAAPPAPARPPAALRAQPPPLVSAPAQRLAAPQPMAAPPLKAPQPRGFSTLPPVVVEDATLVEPKGAGWRWLIAGSIFTAVSAAALVFAISTGRMASGKTVVNSWLVTLGVVSKPATLPSAVATTSGAPGADTTSVSAAATQPNLAPSTAADAPKAAETGTAAAQPAIAPEPTASPGLVDTDPAKAGPGGDTDPAKAGPGGDTDPAKAGPGGDTHPAESGTAKATAPHGEVHALVDQATVRGGKLTDAQLSAAITKATPKLERCYAAALKDKPRTKGRLTFGWTVRPNGKATGVKPLGGSIKDADLGRCTAQVITTTRFPKPHKRAAQIKLPLEYRQAS